MPTIITSRLSARPLAMLGAAACFAAYLFGLVSATPADTAPAPPSAVCTG